MKMKPLFMLCFLLLVLTSPALSRESLKINTSIKPPFSTEQENGFIDLLLKELFQRIGVELELVRLPAERALHMANEGLSDGDLPRIAGLGAKYQNLIEVPEAIIDYNFVAFMRQPVLTDLTWDKLKGQNIGLIIGWKIYEKNVPGEARLTRVASPAQLLHLLEDGRINIALYERYAGSYLIKANQYQGLVECQPPLAVRSMHLYLNKKHADIVDTVAEELRSMKADGSWQKIVAKTLEKQF